MTFQTPKESKGKPKEIHARARQGQAGRQGQAEADRGRQGQEGACRGRQGSAWAGRGRQYQGIPNL